MAKPKISEPMDYILTEHACESISERLIRLEWVDLAFSQPQRIEADRVDSDLEHCLVRIDVYGGRVLRGIVNTARTPLRIVTVLFDRGMRNRL